MLRHARWILLAPLAGCLAAPPGGAGLSAGEATTGVDPTDASTTTSAPSSSAGDPSTTSTTSTTSGGSSSGDDSDTSIRAPLIDVGVDSEGVDPTPLGCQQKKIDFVFLITRGASISVYEEELTASIPDFLAVIDEDLGDFDPHIMVLDGINFWGDSKCTQATCPIDGGCEAIGVDEYPCWAAHDKEALTTCDRTYGAGVVFPAGRGAANERCEFLEGRRYLSRDDPDLAASFACATQVGSLMFDVLPGEELFNAFLPGINGPNGCNAGFLRDDALLVLTLIDGRTIGASVQFYKPYAWANLIHAAKGNDRDAIVALGILPDSIEGVEQPLCKTEPGKLGASGAMHLLLSYFDHALTYSICAPSYGEALAQAAERVHEICDGAAN